jgi:hypothetical protein
MTLGHNESRRLCANVLVLRGGQNDLLRAHWIGALTEEVVRRILLAEGVGNLPDALVDVPEQGLVQRQTFFLSFFHSAEL